MTDLPFSTTRTAGSRHTRRRRGKTRVALVLAGGLALGAGSSAGVEAQQTELVSTTERAAARPERVDAQLALARVCASEIGLSGTPEECAAIHDVLTSRARRAGASFTWAARAYSNRVFDRERRDPRAWVAHLRRDGRRPDGWPSVITIRRRGEARVVRHAPWGAYRDRWLALYDAAGRIVRGELMSQCEGPVDHWGMRSGVDWERAQRAGWEEVRCGETRNAFWRVPPRDQG
ncbi:Hypothetical protein I5071_32160 [Sandaracinus amylolyticus]|nr:Hypothetical protein I5071_32160 [Sandaracinus amylolyticus]